MLDLTLSSDSTSTSFRIGASGNALWLLSAIPSAELERALVHLRGDSTPRPLHWFPSRTAFLRRALRGCNLLPNSDFGGAGDASLAGWSGVAQEPAAVGIDFSDDWRLADRHTAFLFAHQDAPRPALQLAEPVPLVADADLTYRVSGFFATHRCAGVIEIAFCDGGGAAIDTISLPIPCQDDHLTGRSLADYRWRAWSFVPPPATAAARLTLHLDASDSAATTSFLFATHLFLGVADPVAPLAWSAVSPGARELSEQSAQHCWQAWALAEVDRVTQSAGFAVTLGTRRDETALGIELEQLASQSLASEPPASLPDTAAALVDVLMPAVRGLVWIGVRWPVSGTFSYATAPGDLTIGPAPLHSPDSFLAVALAGENLLLNADFGAGLEYWEAPSGSGIDFAPSAQLADGHTAYLHGTAGDAQDQARFYASPILLPTPAARAYRLSGYFAHHRCSGRFGIEWLAEDGRVIDIAHWQLTEAETIGGNQLADYTLLTAPATVPEHALAARLFVEKLPTYPGESDSFLFFTRPFFGIEDCATPVWKTADPSHLERLLAFAASAELFQPLLDAALDQAEDALRANRWPEAARRWQAILDAAGDAAPVRTYLNLSRAQRHCCAFAEAETTLRKGLEYTPWDLELLAEFAEVAMASQNWPAASERWQRLLAMFPDAASPSVYLQLSQSLCQQRRDAEAERILLEGMTRYPDTVNLSVEYAEIAMSQHNWPEAVKRWQGLNP